MSALLSNLNLILLLVFLTFMLVGLGIAGIVGQQGLGARRIGTIGRSSEEVDKTETPQSSLVYEDDRPRILKLLEPFQRTVAQSDPNQVNAARQRMIEAGYYRPTALETYFTARVILGLVLPLIAIVFAFGFQRDWSIMARLFAVIAAAALGYYLPALFITLRISDRREKFKLGMPDALDMMLVGVEAGLSLPASLKHVVKELGPAHPIIAEQFQIVNLEFQAGRSRIEALNGLARRMNIPVTRTLATMISQSEQLGTSLAQTLQVMAQELRVQRTLDAEKRASELPVKMSVPLVLFIFPALMAIALVPAILSIMTFFASV